MNIYDQMVAEYQQQASTSTPNVEQEVMQKIALAGLCRGGFFKHAAVKQDVRGFIFDQRDIEIWSNDYFLKLADMMVLKE